MLDQFDESLNLDRILWMDDDYRYMKPAEHIRHLISHYIVSFPHKSNPKQKYKVLPSLTGVIVIAKSKQGMIYECWGPSFKTKDINEKVFTYSFLLLIEFHHTGLFALLGIEQSSILDQRIELSSISESMKKELDIIVQKAETLVDLSEKLDFYFSSKLILEEQHRFFIEVVNFIIQSVNSISIPMILDEFHYSHRQMNRLFYRYIGVSMKDFLRIVRLNKVAIDLQNGSNNLAQIALHFGYYDQAHLNKEFKMITKTGPKEYKKDQDNFYHHFLKF